MIGDDPDEMGDNLVGVQVAGTVFEMALGESHTCMLLDSADVVCFGKNDAGQLGLGDTDNRGKAVGDVGEAVDFGTGLGAVAITSGCEHTCALLDDGSVKCFGENNYGQLGQGTTDNAEDETGEMGDDLPAVPLTGTVTAVAAGCGFTCALMDDGTVTCWGRNKWGQLGAGDSDDRLDGSGVPLVAVDLDGSVAASIAAGEGHVCALLDDDSVKCWGLNNNGQLGQGEELGRRGDSPETLGANLPAVGLGTGDVPAAIDCGAFHTCILLSDNSVKWHRLDRKPTPCFAELNVRKSGLGNDGQLGHGTDEPIVDVAGMEPVDVGSDTFALTPAPAATLPSAISSAAPTVAVAANGTAAPSAVTRQIDVTSAPTLAPVTLAPLGPGETFPPTPIPTLDRGVEGGNSAPAHFNGGLLATVVLGAVGFLGTLLP
eukprot:g18901.t2